MDLIRVVDSTSKAFETLWQIYESSFPPDERRGIDRQRELFADSRYSLYAAESGGEVVGLLSSWELEKFVFIEHIAVKAELRGRGTGAAMLSAFLEGKKNVILEVEPPSSELQKRRVSFYTRIGFHLNPRDYIQPPYGPGKKPVHLLLMSTGGQLTIKEFEEVRRSLHLSVYALAKPMV